LVLTSSKSEQETNPAQKPSPKNNLFIVFIVLFLFYD
jgi:hypothetical protein